MKTTEPFRNCQLQILRSLYDGQYGDAARERQVDVQLLIGKSHEIGTNEDDSNDQANNGDETTRGGTDRSNEAGGVSDDAREGPVCNETWGLIELFILRRLDYRPLKERQLHWARVNAEAQSRLDRLVSISAAEEETTMLPIHQRSSSLMTPRTPLFSVVGRGSATPTQSLTPLSSNRNAPQLSQSEREMVSTIPSWNFINEMSKRRSDICTELCQSFRSHPFLARLRDEAEMRCTILERVLKRLKMETGVQQQRSEKKREGSLVPNPHGKRQKLSTGGAAEPKEPSSLIHFFSSQLCKMARASIDNEDRHDEDAIMETKMKLYLWSSLLVSVKEVVDEHDK